MAKYVNNSGGILTMPGGKTIPPRGEVEVSAEQAKNVAIKQWIDGGTLAKPKAVKKADEERREAREAAEQAAEEAQQGG